MKILKDHPIIKYADMIKERGVMLFENVTNLPAYGEQYISHNMVVCINHRGHVSAEYNMKKVEFGAGEVAMVMPNHIMTVYSSSEDYLATLLVISGEFLEWMTKRITHMTFYVYNGINSTKFTKEQLDTILAYFRLLDSMSKLDHPARETMLATQISIGTHMIDQILADNEKKGFSFKADKNPLLIKFYNAIMEHYRESREVQFYANLMCMSAKHFGTVIRDSTGLKAGEWIERYVILQAKTILRQRPDMSIQQVSAHMGFTEQASFCRYFKKHTGISPSEYRGETVNES